MVTKQLLPLLVLVLFFFSCGHREGGKTKDNKFKLLAEDVSVIIPELHSLSELKAMFKMSGIGYYPGITNKVSNAPKYSGDQKIAANLGVYMADMTYVITTAGEKRAKNEYKAIMELAKKYGFADEVLTMSYERYEAGNTSVDDFFNLLQAALENSSKQMTESEVSEFHSYFIFGNYIEKLYLVSSLLSYDNKNIDQETEAILKRDLLLLLSNQCARIDEMIYILNKYPDKWSEVVELKDMQKLMEDYLTANTRRDSLLALPPVELVRANEVTSIIDQIDLIRRRIVLY